MAHPLPRAWHAVRAPPTPRGGVPLLARAGASATTVGRHVYLIGGKSGPSPDAVHGDVLRYDATSSTWARGFPALPAPRAHHAAFAVGRTIWVVGGSVGDDVLSDAWCYDTVDQAWTRVELEGDPRLLRRTAAAAALAPAALGLGQATAILHGGYGVSTAGDAAGTTLADCVAIDTAARTARPLPTLGAAPTRAFHTLSHVGGALIALGGRVTRADIVPAADFGAVLDGASRSWGRLDAAGTPPAPRASHRAAVVGDRVILHGGVLDLPGTGGPRSMAGDVVTLVVGAAPRWTRIDEPPPPTRTTAPLPAPAPRALHCFAYVAGHLLLAGGYRDRGEYAADAWTLSVDKTAALAAGRTAAPTPAPRPLPDTDGWRTVKRARPPPVAAAPPADKAAAPPQRQRAPPPLATFPPRLHPSPGVGSAASEGGADGGHLAADLAEARAAAAAAESRAQAAEERAAAAERAAAVEAARAASEAAARRSAEAAAQERARAASVVEDLRARLEAAVAAADAAHAAATTAEADTRAARRDAAAAAADADRARADAEAVRSAAARAEAAAATQMAALQEAASAATTAADDARARASAAEDARTALQHEFASLRARTDADAAAAAARAAALERERDAAVANATAATAARADAQAALADAATRVDGLEADVRRLRSAEASAKADARAARDRAATLARTAAAAVGAWRALQRSYGRHFDELGDAVREAEAEAARGGDGWGVFGYNE